MCSYGPTDSVIERVATRRARMEELEREISELAAHLAAATCRWLLLVAEFDREGGWAEWGAKSCAQWLSWRCSIGRVTAREHVRVARRLAELPLVRQAFATGELSYCKVRAITRVATPEIEKELVELALHATGSQVEKLVRGLKGALAASTDAAQDAHARRGVRVSWEDDGSLRLEARLTADDGALVLAALKAAEEAEGGTPGNASEARRADALVSVARAAIPADEAPPEEGGRFELVVHVDVESLAGDQVADRCELDQGPVLAPETVRRLGCDGSVVRIIERDGRPLSVSRRKRAVSGRLRCALRSRDAGCQFPGCTHRRFLHAHHIHHWARGGPTTLDNLVQLCSHHHRLVHEGGFCVERGGKHAIRFRRPDGQVIARVPRGPGGSSPALVRGHEALGVDIDSKTCMPRSMGDPLDYDLAVMWFAERHKDGT